MNQSKADQYYRNSAVIAGALIVGQLLFAGVSWFLYNSGSRTPSGEELLNVLTYVWIGLTFSVLAIGLMLRQRIIADAEQNMGVGTTSRPPSDPAEIQTRIITMLAVLETAGLMGIVVYFLHGHPQMLFVVLGYIVVSAIMFFPRREWFGATS